MNEPLRCHSCDDVIGMYEPMVVLSGGHARSTSRAAEQREGTAAGHSYHRECYPTEHGEQAPPVGQRTPP